MSLPDKKATYCIMVALLLNMGPLSKAYVCAHHFLIWYNELISWLRVMTGNVTEVTWRFLAFLESQESRESHGTIKSHGSIEMLFLNKLTFLRNYLDRWHEAVPNNNHHWERYSRGKGNDEEKVLSCALHAVSLSVLYKHPKPHG